MKRSSPMDRKKSSPQSGSKKAKTEEPQSPVKQPVQVLDNESWYRTFKRLEVLRNYLETYDGEQDPSLFIDKINKHRKNLGIPLDLIVENLNFYFRDSKDEEVRRWYTAKKVFVQYWLRQKINCEEIWANFSKSLCAYFCHDRNREAKYGNLDSFQFMNGMSAVDFISTLVKLYRRVDPNASDEDVIKKAISKLPGELSIHPCLSAEKSLPKFEENLQCVIDNTATSI